MICGVVCRVERRKDERAKVKFEGGTPFESKTCLLQPCLRRDTAPPNKCEHGCIVAGARGMPEEAVAAVHVEDGMCKFLRVAVYASPFCGWWEFRSTSEAW